MSSVAPISLGELRAIPVERLNGVGEKRREGLAAVGVHNLLDLLTTYPAGGSTGRAGASRTRTGESALVVVTLRSVSSARRATVARSRGRRRRRLGRMHVVFFNQPWRQRQFADLIERGKRDGDGHEDGAVSVALFGKATCIEGRCR